MNGPDDTPTIFQWHELIDEIDDIVPTTNSHISNTDVTNDRMFARIVQLMVGLFDRGYFEKPVQVNFEAQPGLYFTERLRRLLKLTIMSETLIQTIIPKIRRKISFSSERHHETHRFSVRGAIDPIKTLQKNHFMTSVPYLNHLVSHRPIKNYHTPENILTVLTLLELRDDAYSLNKHPQLSLHMHSRERQLLQDVVVQSHRALKTSLFTGLIPESKRLLNTGNRTELDKITREAESRIHHMKGPHTGYQALLLWRKQYKSIDITKPGMTFESPARALTPDRAYELLVLLELLVCLSRHGRLRQWNALSGSTRKTHTPAFECRFFTGEVWEIYFQTGYPVKENRYIKHLTGIPDIIIRNPTSRRMLICDAKQYTISSYGNAFYKIMGYLYQFGYPDTFSQIAGGILFVPQKIGQEAGWTIWAGTGSTAHQALATLTIPADGAVTQETHWDLDRFISFAKKVL